jgi:hypothetical protein
MSSASASTQARGQHLATLPPGNSASKQNADVLSVSPYPLESSRSKLSPGRPKRRSTSPTSTS